MKHSVIIVSLILIGCTQQPNSNTKKHTQIVQEVVQEKKKSEDSPNEITNKTNYTDSFGLKQGRWITRGYKDKIVRIETFKDDTLNGYWFNWEGMHEEGNYVDGKKHGFFRVYYGDKSEKNVMLLKLFENDSVLWYALPAADSRSAIPIKGFYTTIDSVFIEAPHYNSSIWYKGLFVNNKPIGKHYIYDENKRLLATTNYTDSTIRFTNYVNEQFINTTKMMANGWTIVPKTH